MRGNDSGNPKEEGFCKMLYVTFCPRLKLLSLTACLVAINVIMFALTLALGVSIFFHYNTVYPFPYQFKIIIIIFI